MRVRTRGSCSATGDGGFPQNAASVAGLLLTTEVMVAEAPKEEEHSHGPMPGGGMGGMHM